MSSVDIIEEHRCHGGRLLVVRHNAPSTRCAMRFSIFLPPAATAGGDEALPVVTWLSGLTCTEENFTVKAGAYRKAAELGLVVVAPDTSPRGEGVPDDPAYDLGQGAGFYLNATEAPWSDYFLMYDYVTRDLPDAVFGAFPGDRARQSIMGHSMGGHGALVIALREAGTYRSVSAFAPIAAPVQSAWGEQVFTAYLGPDREAWRAYDATDLMTRGVGAGRYDDILIDQGTADEFYEGQLKPELFTAACERHGQAVTLRLQEGYDHSYYFIQSFIDDHLAFHADRLKRG